MRQLIIGADVAGPYDGSGGADTTEGAVAFHSINAAGVPTLMNKAAATQAKADDSLVRVGRIGASVAEMTQASPWFRPSDVVGFTAKKYDAGQIQKAALEVTVVGAVGDVVNLKVIFTTSGYEPFERFNFEAKLSAATDTGACTDLKAAVDAQIANGMLDGKITQCDCGNAADGNPSVLVLHGAEGERFETAFDAGGSDLTLASYASTVQDFVFPVGTYAKLLAEEVEQQGREYSNYDRMTYLPDENKTYALDGEVYNEYSLIIRNSAEGQIRGVDNLRTIKIAIPSGTNASYLDSATAGDSNEEGFEFIMKELTGYERPQANE